MIIRALLVGSIALYALSGILGLLGRRTRLPLFVAFAAHCIFLVDRAVQGSELPVWGLAEPVHLLPLCCAIPVLAARLMTNQSRHWRGTELLVAVLLVLAALYPQGFMLPAPQKIGILPAAFFIFESLAYACFILAAFFSMSILIGGEKNGAYHEAIVWGFVAYSTAQVAGAAWSHLGWGAPLSWSGRHLHSLALWLFYASYLHLRFVKSWKQEWNPVYALASGLLVTALYLVSCLREMSFPRIGG